jgi:hypothetical protein
MEDETAYERQHGPLPPPRSYPAVRPVVEPEWQEALEEFRRLKRSGMSHAAAVQVFRPLLADPQFKDAAQLMIEIYGG